MTTLFALTKNNDQYEVFRIPLTQQLQVEISNSFTTQTINFFEDKETIIFDGSYKTDPEELFVLEDFQLPLEIVEAVQQPLGLDVLDMSELEGRIISIFATLGLQGLNHIIFQYFDARKILANRGISIFLREGTYNKIDTKGIVIEGKATAVFRDNNLYFSSYHLTNRFLDLLEFYEDATEEDIDTFVDHGTLSFEDEISFRDHLNSTLRKKIKLIRQNGVLEAGANLLAEKAAEFDIDCELVDDCLRVPSDVQAARRLIRFLDEDYFTTTITGRKCLTNSKRVIG